MKNPTVSVAMATYNGEKYLREQLDSLYSQTRVPDEVVVVDDKSEDTTTRILEEYRIKHGLRYIVNTEKLGVSRNFEKAIKNCKGDYIAICDQDDIWMPHKIQTLLSKLQEVEDGKPACVSSRRISVDKDMVPFSSANVECADTFGIKCNIIGSPRNGQGCTMMINRSLALSFAPFPKSNFVYDGYISQLASCIGVKYNLCKPLMYYRYHDNNVVASRKKIGFFNKIVTHLRMWKYSSFIWAIRYDILRFINEHNRDMMPDDVKQYIDKVLLYPTMHFYQKIGFIWNEDYFSTKEKIRRTYWILLSFWLPLKSTYKSF